MAGLENLIALYLPFVCELPCMLKDPLLVPLLLFQDVYHYSVGSWAEIPIFGFLFEPEKRRLIDCRLFVRTDIIIFATF